MRWLVSLIAFYLIPQPHHNWRHTGQHHILWWRLSVSHEVHWFQPGPHCVHVVFQGVHQGLPGGLQSEDRSSRHQVVNNIYNVTWIWWEELTPVQLVLQKHCGLHHQVIRSCQCPTRHCTNSATQGLRASSCSHLPSAETYRGHCQWNGGVETLGLQWQGAPVQQSVCDWEEYQMPYVWPQRWAAVVTSDWMHRVDKHGTVWQSNVWLSGQDYCWQWAQTLGLFTSWTSVDKLRPCSLSGAARTASISFHSQITPSILPQQ